MKTDEQRLLDSIKHPKKIEQDKDAMIGRRVYCDSSKVIRRPISANDVQGVGLFVGNLIIR